MTSSLAGQVLDVGVQRRRDACEYLNRRITPPAFDPAQIGLMHFSAMGELLLREPSLPSQALQVQADSHPHVHARMARSDLTSAHRL